MPACSPPRRARSRATASAYVTGRLPRSGRLVGEEGENAAEHLLEVAPLDDHVELSVRQQKLRALESLAKRAVTPPVVGSVRIEMYGSPLAPSRSSAAEVLAICIRERMPSCIRAPPDAETMTTGRCLSIASSIARVSFSPTTEPMLPPRKPNSKTARTAGNPPIEAMPQITASSLV